MKHGQITDRFYQTIMKEAPLPDIHRIIGNIHIMLWFAGDKCACVITTTDNKRYVIVGRPTEVTERMNEILKTFNIELKVDSVESTEDFTREG